jgi:RNA polymerase sigma-54 factor
VRLDLGLQLQQTQRLVLTPELRQAIAILQQPITELASYMEAQLLENPCLETEPVEENDGPLPRRPDAAALLRYLGAGEGSGGPIDGDEEESSDERFLQPPPTLQEHLLAQLSLSPLRGLERAVVEYLIGSLDDRGYLTIDLGEVVAHFRVPLVKVEALLAHLQAFDPPGVGARSLQECLLLQWGNRSDGNRLVPLLIQHHLNDLAEGRIVRIAKERNVTPAEVQAAADLIRRLDPKPGRRFGRANETRYVIPDVTIERVDREFLILVNESPLPRLRVNRQYRQLLEGSAEAPARKWVEERIAAALNLIRAVEQRRQTLYRVTEAILAFQREFFLRGPRYLRPLTLREVGDRIGVHESTVSRATAGKWVQTPHGLLAFKYFFTSGVSGAGGEGIAAEAVKRLIADLVAKESPENPLSDQALAQRLNEQGIAISRRTVAKYREEMGVPASSKRRRFA